MRPQGYKLTAAPHGMEKEENRRLMKSLEVALNEERPCYNPNCGIQTTSNSHVIQHRGEMLESIATNGSVMERSPGDPFNPRRFTQRGIKGSDVLAFVGFCNDKNGGNRCDAKLFEEVEGNNSPDFDNYWHNLLFAYRAHLCLMRKGQAWNDAYNRVAALDDSTFEAKLLAAQHQQSYDIKHPFLERIKYLFEQEVYGDRAVVENNFQFTHVVLPHHIELAACSTFGIPEATALRWHNNIVPYDVMARVPDGYSPFFYYVAVIPLKGKSHFIIGRLKGIEYLEGIKIDLIPKLKPVGLYNLISKLLLKRFDTWCVSTRLFELMKATHGLDYLEGIMDTYRYIYSESAKGMDQAKMPLNLFKGVIKGIK
jgi:hypothetical protein